MSDFDRNMRESGFQGWLSRNGFSSGSVVGGAVVVVLLLVVIGYLFADRSTTGPTMIERPAATTMTPAPATPAPTPPSAPASPEAQKP